MADPSTSPPLTRASVIAALDLIRPFVHHTPTITNATLSAMASSSSYSSSSSSSSSSSEGGGPGGESKGEEGEGEEGEEGEKKKARPKMRLWFKCENLQRVGAFKVRGAFHALERLKREPGWEEGGGRERGVVTHSSGNHAQALALAARESGIPAHIVMPAISAGAKVAATRGYGARVTFSGSTSEEREARVADVIVATGGARLVPPYDHPDVVLGQGTLGLEMQRDVRATMLGGGTGGGAGDKGEGEGEDGGRGRGFVWVPATSTGVPEAKIERVREGKHPGLDAILAPCGGGGMLAGVALSCEGTGIRVYGCEPSESGADDGKRGFESGTRVERVASLTVADGLRTPLGRVPWGVIYERPGLVRGFYAVSDAQIRAAMRLVYERLKMVVEPSAVVGLAVALYDDDFRAMVEREAGEEGWDVGIVFSGGNVSLDALGALFAEEKEEEEVEGGK
ncbi:tryptophan synthase beta subunit-like PLP-dependent enzyme [Biscogniauxia mediterranea]|nr:tryptophan synthase beta subunit-like PLP-dependent enzyme [Biscogniauxia mediterranea]